MRIISGTQQAGVRSQFLSRFHDQITLLARSPVPASAHSSWFRRHPQKGVIIAQAALDHALALDIPAVPLLKALSIADCETAEKLGCLSLVEEDVAALSSRCTSGADYGKLLREVLDELMVDAA